MVTQTWFVELPNLNIHFLHVAVVLEDNDLPNSHRLVPVQFEPAAEIMARNARPARLHAAIIGQRRSHALIILKSGRVCLQRNIRVCRIRCKNRYRADQGHGDGRENLPYSIHIAGISVRRPSMNSRTTSLERRSFWRADKSVRQCRRIMQMLRTSPEPVEFTTVPAGLGGSTTSLPSAQ